MSTESNAATPAAQRSHPLLWRIGLFLRAEPGVAVESFTLRFRSVWGKIPADSQYRLARLLNGGALATYVYLVRVWPDEEPANTTSNTPFASVSPNGRSIAYCGPALEVLPVRPLRVAVAEPLARAAAIDILHFHPDYRERENERPLQVFLRDKYGHRDYPVDLRAATNDVLNEWGFRPDYLIDWVEVEANRRRLIETLMSGRVRR